MCRADGGAAGPTRSIRNFIRIASEKSAGWSALSTNEPGPPCNRLQVGRYLGVVAEGNAVDYDAPAQGKGARCTGLWGDVVGAVRQHIDHLAPGGERRPGQQARGVLDRRRDVGRKAASPSALRRCAGRLSVAKARLTESVTQACGDRDRRCFRFDQQPGYRRREVALARPREDREADPAVVTSGNGLRKSGSTIALTMPSNCSASS